MNYLLWAIVIMAVLSGFGFHIGKFEAWINPLIPQLGREVKEDRRRYEVMDKKLKEQVINAAMAYGNEQDYPADELTVQFAFKAGVEWLHNTRK